MAKYYTDLRIPVYNFHQALNGDLSALYIDEKGNEDLSEVWKEIYNLYCDASCVDNRHLMQYAKIDALEFKYERVKAVIELLPHTDTENFIYACEVLKSHNYFIDVKKEIQPQVDRCINQLKSLYTKINIEKAKLPKEDKKEAVSLMKQVVAIENIFPGRSIDIYLMSMEKWIALQQTANEKTKQELQYKKQR